jgi:hypothetical protein
MTDEPLAPGDLIRVVSHRGHVLLTEREHRPDCVSHSCPYSHFFGVTTMAAEAATWKLEPKNIDEMIEGLKKAAKSKGFNFKGDKTSGKASNDGVTVEYSVKGKEVTVRGQISYNLWDMEQMVKEWLKPYNK